MNPNGSIRISLLSIALLGFTSSAIFAQTTPPKAANGTSKDSGDPQISHWRVPKAKGAFTDEDVVKAIQKGVDYIWSLQKDDGSWEGLIEERYKYPCGPTALACYALLECGVTVKDPKMQKALDWLVAKQDDDTMDYTVGLRANVWFNANKQTSNKYMKQLQKEVERLIGTAYVMNGGSRYETYTLKEGMEALKNWPKIKDAADTGQYGYNSNAQYILLGVWAAHRNNMEIPKEFWQVCLNHWIRRQMPDGGWLYGYWDKTKGNTYGSMTAAGLASLFVCMDATMGDMYIKCGLPPEFAPIKKGLDWFDKNFEATLEKPMDNDGRDAYFFTYYMYGVERVGLASGYKYFGKYDWFKEGTKRLLARQIESGKIPDNLATNVASTAYALLFLSRGQKPVLMNHLEYEGDWNNRPRGMAGLTRWMSKAFETDVNWQIVTLKSPVDEWHDAPILCLTGNKAPKLSDEDIGKLRTFVNQGGTIFSISECNGAAAFGRGMREAYKKMFPKYELSALGADHPIYSVGAKLRGNPRLFAISNGVRLLAIHTDTDLPLAWQQYAVATMKSSFEAGGNVALYLTDKQFKNRGSNVWPGEYTGATDKTVKVARLKLGGNDDPEPLAWQRLARLMGWRHKVKVEVADPIEPAALADAKAQLAAGTGTAAFTMEQAQKDALKKFVQDGGTVILDAAGGSKAFYDSAVSLIDELWGKDSMQLLALDSPVYTLKDMTIAKVQYRRDTRKRLGPMKEPRLMAVMVDGRPAVIISQEDMTGGMVGYTACEMDGYESDSAMDLMRNVLFYVATLSVKAK